MGHPTSSDHDKLEEDEDWRENLGVVQLGVLSQFLTEQVLEDKEKGQHREAPRETEKGSLVGLLEKNRFISSQWQYSTAI